MAALWQGLINLLLWQILILWSHYFYKFTHLMYQSLKFRKWAWHDIIHLLSNKILAFLDHLRRTDSDVKWENP